MARDADQDSRPVIIKKYANRRLYNTGTSTYVTLEDLAEMVRGERDFVVYDAKTGEDLTHAVLTQIIVEQESRGTNLLPIGFLRQLIRFYGDSMQKLVPSYLEFSLDSLTKQQEEYRERLTQTFGNPAFDAMQEQVRKNFDAFERALGMFTPFSGLRTDDANAHDANAHDGKVHGGKVHGGKVHGGKAEDEKKLEAKSEPDGNDYDTLKAELQSMQQRLDKLSRGKTDTKKTDTTS